LSFLSDLKELNRTAPRFTTQELDRNQCTHGRPQKIFQRGQRQILLIIFRLLTMQCKCTFTKRFTLSTPLVCAGRTSILNHLSEMFSTLRLSEMLFLFMNCIISIFRALSTNSLSQWFSTFFVQSPPYRNFASKSPPLMILVLAKISFKFEYISMLKK